MSVTKRNLDLSRIYCDAKEGVELGNIVNLLMKNNKFVIRAFAIRHNIIKYLDDYQGYISMYLYTLRDEFDYERASGNVFKWIISCCQRSYNKVIEDIGAMKVSRARTSKKGLKYDQKTKTFKTVYKYNLNYNINLATTSLSELEDYGSNFLEILQYKAEDNDYNNILDSALKKEQITQQQRDVINYRIYHQMTFEEISLFYGVSRERIRQVYLDGLSKLQRALMHDGELLAL